MVEQLYIPYTEYKMLSRMVMLILDPESVPARRAGYELPAFLTKIIRRIDEWWFQMNKN